MRKSWNTYSEEYVNKLYQEHLGGKSLTILAKEYNKHRSSFYVLFKRRGLKTFKDINSAKRDKSPFNEQYFNVIDSHEKAYILGLIYSDGWIVEKSENSKTVGLAFKKEDEYVLDYVKEQFKSSKQIHFNPKTNSSKVEFSSEIMVNDLIKLGVKYRKSSKEVEFPKIEEKYLFSFILGIFDGDGSVGTYSTGVSLSICSSSNIFATLLKDFLLKHNIDCSISISKRSLKNPKHLNLYILNIRRKGILLFIKKIYENNSFSMIRKKEKCKYVNTVLTNKYKSLLAV